MKELVSGFKEYLLENPVQCREGYSGLLVECFGDYYRTRMPIETTDIRTQLEPAEAALRPLSQKRERRLLYVFKGICEEYQRQAFLDGMRVGAQLVMELSDEK